MLNRPQGSKPALHALRGIVSILPQLDIIIEDGLHTPRANMNGIETISLCLRDYCWASIGANAYSIEHVSLLFAVASPLYINR